MGLLLLFLIPALLTIVSAQLPGCGNGILEPGEQCDSGMHCLSGTNIAIAGATVSYSFKYVPYQTNIYVYDLWIYDVTQSSQIVPDRTYAFQCSRAGLLLQFSLNTQLGNVGSSPVFEIYWTYLALDASTCSNYDITLASYTFNDVQYKFRRPTGPLFSQTYTDAAYEMLPNNYCGTLCCNTTCQIPPPSVGQQCPLDTPQFVPAYTNWTCNVEGICLLEFGSPSNTPTPSPSNTATRTPSRSPSASPGASGTSTPSPLPSGSATASPGPSVTSTSTSTSSPIPFGSVTRTPTAVVSASGAPKKTAATDTTPLIILGSINGGLLLFLIALVLFCGSIIMARTRIITTRPAATWHQEQELDYD